MTKLQLPLYEGKSRLIFPLNNKQGISTYLFTIINNHNLSFNILALFKSFNNDNCHGNKSVISKALMVVKNDYI